MTLHLYMHHKCSECETEYLPYNETIACPKCGDKPEMEDYFPFVEGICESFLFNIGDVGRIVPYCWASIDLSDTLQLFFFKLFSNWIEEMKEHEPQERAKAFETFLNNVTSKMNFKEREYLSDYITDLAIAIYNEFFNVRGILLTQTDKGLKIVNA